jgi:hypothetical protein
MELISAITLLLDLPDEATDSASEGKNQINMFTNPTR